MPQPTQNIDETTPKRGTYQYTAARQAGLILKLQDGVESVTNRRIVSIQQDSNNRLFAVPGIKPYPEDEYTNMIVLTQGVLEQALQSGGINSIAPDQENLVDGDEVTVLANLHDVYQVDYDPENVPADGIALSWIDIHGRLTSENTADNFPTLGSVFEGVPGSQMKNQLLENAKFFKFMVIVPAAGP